MMKLVLASSLLALVGCASQTTATRASTSHHAALACQDVVGSPEGTRAFSVVAAKALTERTGKQMLVQTRGARVLVKAEPALTQAWLQRAVSCRIAHFDNLRARGVADGELSTHPLAVAGVTARVVPVHGAFAIDITTNDPSDARAVVARANRTSL